jgi:hypothetical protein
VRTRGRHRAARSARGGAALYAVSAVLLVLGTLSAARSIEGAAGAAGAALAREGGTGAIAAGAPPLTGVPVRELAALGQSDRVVPVGLRIPTIGVRSAVERLRLDRSGQLQPPVSPERAGWWVDGVVPGELGAAVVIGHLDSRTGPALFWRLHELRAGDVVTVARSDGTRATFTVDRVRLLPTDDFPTALVYGPTPDRQLRLITCGGGYDAAAGHYRDNVVVFAREAGA